MRLSMMSKRDRIFSIFILIGILICVFSPDIGTWSLLKNAGAIMMLLPIAIYLIGYLDFKENGWVAWLMLLFEGIIIGVLLYFGITTTKDLIAGPQIVEITQCRTIETIDENTHTRWYLDGQYEGKEVSITIDSWIAAECKEAETMNITWWQYSKKLINYEIIQVKEPLY